MPFLSLYRLCAGRFRREVVCIARTQGGSKTGPRECNFVLVSFAVSPARMEVPKVDLANATLSWYRLLVSSARREVPKVDLGKSWYRLFVSPARGEVPKVDLGNAT